MLQLHAHKCTEFSSNAFPVHLGRFAKRIHASCNMLCRSIISIMGIENSQLSEKVNAIAVGFSDCKWPKNSSSKSKKIEIITTSNYKRRTTHVEWKPKVGWCFSMRNKCKVELRDALMLASSSAFTLKLVSIVTFSVRLSSISSASSPSSLRSKCVGAEYFAQNFDLIFRKATFTSLPFNKVRRNYSKQLYAYCSYGLLGAVWHSLYCKLIIVK